MNIQQAIAKAQTQLDQLNPRERKLVGWGGLFAALAITWFVLIEPAWLTIQNAPANQQALAEKAAQVMRAADELEALRGARSRVQVREEDLEGRLAQLLVETGVQQQTTLRRTEEGEFRLDFTEAPAVGFLAWMAKVDGISSLTVHRMEMEKVAAGSLTGYVALLPKGGPTSTP